MSLKNLGKKERNIDLDKASEFIGAATFSTDEDNKKEDKRKREVMFKRCTYSLTDETDTNITEVAKKWMLSEGDSISRSEVVKIAIEHLHSLEKDDLIEIIKRYK